MNKSPIYIDFNPKEIKAKLKDSSEIALGTITKKVVKDTTIFVPVSPKKHKYSGRLRRSAKITQPNKNKPLRVIRYSRKIPGHGDGVKNLYEGYNAVKYDPRVPVKRWNKNEASDKPGPYWFDRSKAENTKKWVDEFDAEMRKIWRNRKRKQRKK